MKLFGADNLARFSGIYVLGLFILIFSLWVPATFLTVTTLKSVLGDQAITLILALGLLVPLAAGQFDLSVAQNLGLAAIVCGALQTRTGLGWPECAAIAIACGALVGAANGGLILFGVDSFIATLGMSSILLAFTTLVSRNEFVGPLSEGFQKAASAEPLGFPIVTLYALLGAAVLWWLLEHTPIGRRTYATGANRDAARLAGVRTARHTFLAMVICGAVAALAGVLVAAKVGQVAPTLGPPYLLPAFAACFLGTTQIKVGRFNVLGTVVAIYLLAVGVKGLQLAGGELWVTEMFNGVALVGAVTVAVFGNKRRNRRLKAETERA
ncbi:MAG: ABC transporter permease [Actinobacteria bacterium]|nr:ABC transporter permease [Actinomycetota bacterium]